jgi:hypothetical protein
MTEEQYNTYNLGVTWNEFGDQDRPDLDQLMNSFPSLTAQQRTKLVSAWKNHPNRGKHLLSVS